MSAICESRLFSSDETVVIFFFWEALGGLNMSSETPFCFTCRFISVLF